ncbi:hypothetical protein N9Z18_01840 [Verrucomicrobiales bacterium]|nr:hypothetical protein [Verrucomicrobiales bacterium]MDA7926508.1 hypothetical protein [Verrucomicrobiales bacterium]MDB4358964.1 hypothetical protein [Verrucomicrobiales bacterium]
MAGLKDGDDFKDGEFFKNPFILKVGVGLVGFGGLLVFLLLNLFLPEKRGEMSYSWLFAVVFFLSLSVGGVFWTLLHHATNSGWGTVIRRLMENLGSLIPFLLLLALPFLIPNGYQDSLWEWFPKREAALEKSEAAAEEGAAQYVVERQSEIAGAEAAVAAAEAELAAVEAPSAGHRAHFERKIDSLKTKASKLIEQDLSEDAVHETLLNRSFQKEEALLYVKKGYLNEGAWYGRFIFYFIALSGISLMLRRWSVGMDKTGDPNQFLWLRRSSCGFLPFFATAWTFLVFDWLMALDYTWFSTMWGVYLFAGAALNSMGLLVILITILRRFGYLKNIVTVEHYHLMGKLMLAFVIFWAYIAFSQFFLIWYANITEETKFYLTRNTEFWNTYTITFLVVGHFFVPFSILLIQKVKKLPLVLSAVAVWNLCMHVLDIYWIIIPERGPSLTAGGPPSEMLMVMPWAFLFDILAFVSVAGIFVFFLLWRLGSASLFPCRDPRLDESLNVVN